MTLDSNPLYDYFQAHTGRLVHKWDHYFDIYHRHFAEYRFREIVVLEIGVGHGGSLQMWKHYFGPQARIVGIDNDPRCAAAIEDGIQVHVGSQADTEFLDSVVNALPSLDIVIDDGSHRMEDLRSSFAALYPCVSPEGLYVVEDLHTCYWKEYGGGYLSAASFVEYAKGLIDQLNAWHSQSHDALKCDYFSCATKAMHFYDSVIVFEKGARTPPTSSMRGVRSF